MLSLLFIFVFLKFGNCEEMKEACDFSVDHTVKCRNLKTVSLDGVISVLYLVMENVERIECNASNIADIQQVRINACGLTCSSEIVKEFLHLGASVIVDGKQCVTEEPNKNYTLDALLAKVKEVQRQKIAKPGSVYYRWGSTKCGPKSELIYDGIVGGGYFSRKGAAVNALCLPRDPDLEVKPADSTTTTMTYIYGAEYQMGPKPNNDVPCAVCSATLRQKNIMIPAKLTCPDGWSTEYKGWLAAGHQDHAASTEYVCIDGGYEAEISGASNDEGYLFYHVAAHCGSLPCPKYENGKVLTCVVCSI